MVAVKDREPRNAGPDTGPDRPGHRAWDETALGEIADLVGGLREELSQYVAIRIARLKLSLGETLLAIAGWTVLGLVALVVLATAAVFCFAGVAGWISEATGRPWLGSLLTGAAGLLLSGVGFLVVRRILTRKVLESAGDDG